MTSRRPALAVFVPSLEAVYRVGVMVNRFHCSENPASHFLTDIGATAHPTHAGCAARSSLENAR